MKRISSLIFVILLGISYVVSQPPQGNGNSASPEGLAKKATEWMVKELNLEQEQIAPVDSVNLLFAKVRIAYFQAVDGDRNKVREAMVTIEEEREISLSKILTPEQMKLYKAKVKEVTNRAEKKEKKKL